MLKILETKRTQNQGQRAGAHQSCNLFITYHDGRIRFRSSCETEYKYRRSVSHRQTRMLFRKKPVPRHELLKIDGRMLEVRLRLNPRARRMIVKVNPATGEVSVTAPSRRGLAHALDFARRDHSVHGHGA